MKKCGEFKKRGNGYEDGFSVFQTMHCRPVKDINKGMAK
jgi:hypothetical protein